MKGYFLSYQQGYLRLFLAIVLFLVPFLESEAQCPNPGVTVNITDVTCNGFNDGTIELIVDDPNGYAGDYDFIIVGLPESGGSAIVQNQSGTSSSAFFTGLPPGSYTYFITFPTCPGFTGSNITISQPAVLTANLDNIIPACSPGTGAIEITVAGGNGGYSYSWAGPTNPGDVEDPVGLDAGNYTVTVTDAAGCTVQIVDIFVPVITAADAGPDQVVCDATATLEGNAYTNPGELGTWTLVSGSGNITDPTNPNTTVTNLGEGDNVFEWFITDDNGICPGTTDLVTISWYNLQLSDPADILLACNGVADGSGSFSVTGGTAPFVFSVDVNTSGATTASNAASLDFTNAGPGVITVTVTDADGCSQQQSITISEPPALVIDSETATDVTCNGASDGTVSVAASGGTGTLTYTIMPGGSSNTTGSFTGLSAGDYTVEVTDLNGCGPVSTSTLSIGSPTAIVIDNVTDTDVTCNGGNDGEIEVTASGGTGVLTYTLQPSATANTTGIFSGLTAGTYTVDITDENGCGPVSTADIVITEPAGVNIDNIAFTDVTCSGASDGTITISASGGVTPYTYTLLPANVSNATGAFTGLAPGTYTVEITEANGCGPVTTADITINDPNAILVSAPVTTDATCNGGSDGTLSVTASGGTGTLTYTIQPLGLSNTTGSFTGLATGAYTVDVSDINGCSVTSAVGTVGEPAGIVIDNVAVTDSSCPAGSDGEITVTASGGTGTLTYTLLPSAVSNTTGTFTGLASGTYSVEVTDQNNCGPVVAPDIVVSDPDLDQPVTDVAICSPASNDIILTLISPVNGTTFEIQTLGGASLTPPVQASGPAGPVDLVIAQADAPLVTTSYQVAVTLPSCSEYILPDLFVVTVTDAPSDALTVSDAAICEGENTDVSFIISSSENGVSYELQLTDGSSLTPPVTAIGNGGDLSLTILQADLPAVSTTYQVAASAGGGCSSVLTDQPVLTVTPSVTLDVTIAADQLPVCNADPATFRATVTNGGALPTYQWQVNGVDVPGETSDVFTTTLLNDGDLVRVVVNADPSVTCVSGNPATSNELTFSSTADLTASVSILADQNPACTGSDITFTATPIDAGPNPTYQWQVNGADVAGETNDIFVASGLNDGDLVRVILTPDPSVSCITNATAVSNEIQATFVADLTAAVTILADQNPVCSGTDVTFTSTVTDAGANPTYQWQVNGADVAGQTSGTFISNSLSDGDVVRLVVTADPLAACVSNSPVTSNEISITLQPSTTMTVAISADQNPVCQGDLVTFTANVTDGGANPGYQWQVNGVDAAGETASVFASSTLNNLDVVTVTITADPALSCVINSPLTSNGILMDVTGTLTPSVSITADQSAICTGTDITFTAVSADAGASPEYQWQVNGTDVPGETGTSFTTNSLNDGDQVQVVLTADPSLTCVNPAVVTSNVIDVSVVNSLNPSVTIAADQNPVCTGDPVTWTATVTEAGANPTFQWLVNGTAVAGETNQDFTSSALNDGDLVSVEVTVDPAATCAVSSVVSSTQEAQSVVNSLTPTVAISATQTTICPGNQVIFTANATDAGVSPTFQWQVNGSPVAGATSDTFTTSTLNDGDQVNVIVTVDPSVSCATTTMVTSSTIDMTVRPAGDPACTGGGENCGAFVVTVTPVRPPCTAPDSGELEFIITGGSGNYSIVLSDTSGFSQGETGVAGTPIVFDNLTASDYTYTITDGNGTTCTLPYTLDNETILEAAILGTTDVSCFDEPDGSVTIEIVSGGNAPYEYSLDGILWRQVTTSVFTVDGLSPQESPVGILIRDNPADQCPEELMVNINNIYPEITADISTLPVLTCGGDEGEITVVYPPAGGNAPNGLWNIAIAEGMNPPAGFDPFGADRTFTGLVAGEYTILLEDEGGCVKEIPVIVEAPNQVQLIADVNPADCSDNGMSGELNLQVTNSSQVPGPYELVITGVTGANAGQVIFADAAWSGGFISLDTLVSGRYEIMVAPSDPNLCALTVEREITGGPQPISFDYELSCAPGTSNKELLLTNISGNDGELYTLRVFDNLTSALVEEINFSLNIGDQYLITNYLFLTNTREYRLRLVQSPAICGGVEVKYDHPDNLVIPQQLMAQIGETTQSLPDRATGTLQVINFTGGYQPDDNAFPYLTYIEMDSAAVPGQSYSAGFDTVRLDQNLDFSIIYEDVPAGRYRVMVADQIGCTRELVARVPLDTDIFIPNIFTPNGDGSNETFYIRNKPDTPVRVIITNRWGKQVYSSGDYQNNWDGGDQPDGVYYYLIEAGENSYKGWVEILRGARP